jgi:hypothetical protein
LVVDLRKKVSWGQEVGFSGVLLQKSKGFIEWSTFFEMMESKDDKLSIKSTYSKTMHKHTSVSKWVA